MFKMSWMRVCRRLRIPSVQTWRRLTPTALSVRGKFFIKRKLASPFPTSESQTCNPFPSLPLQHREGGRWGSPLGGLPCVAMAISTAGAAHRLVGWPGQEGQGNTSERLDLSFPTSEWHHLVSYSVILVVIEWKVYFAGGVTPIDSIVTAATARSELWPALFRCLTVDHADFRLWLLAGLNFNRRPLTPHTFTEVYRRMHMTPSLP